MVLRRQGQAMVRGYLGCKVSWKGVGRPQVDGLDQ